MKRLLHPLLTPLYTFAFFVELERQSYSIDILVISLMAGCIICLSLSCAMITKDIGRRIDDDLDPLMDPEAGLGIRIISALTLSAGYAFITYLSTTPDISYNWGLKYIFPIYILPTMLNILSGKGLSTIFPRLEGSTLANMNSAPYTFTGSATGFVLMVGHKTSTDTTLPFMIALILFTLISHLGIANHNYKPWGALYCYIAGIAQAIIAMFIFS